MTEPKIVAQGSGWRVFRVGRSFCVSLDQPDADPRELWMSRATDMARTAGLLTLIADGADEAAAREAMQATW